MRRRFIQINGELIEVGPGYRAPIRTNTDAVLWNDRSYQGVDSRFSSRTTHREYMKRHGLTTVDDFKGTFASAEKSRAEFFSGKDASRRADIAKAMHGKR